jgi:Spy/CpxP family protein refolding chaperone
MNVHTNMKGMNMNGRLKNNGGMAARIGIIMMALLLSTGVAFANKGKGHGEGGKKGDRIAKMMEKLELTDAQKTQIETLRNAFQQENAAAIERGKALREQMHAQKESGDKEAAKATREQMKEAMSGLKEARQELHEDILAVLTAEQRAQLDAMKEKGKDKMKEKKERKGKKGADAEDLD